MIKKIYFIMIIATFLFGQNKALVNVEKLEKGKISSSTQFTGTVKFKNTSRLPSQTSGLVKNIYFEVGQRVKKGDVLLKIDSSILKAEIKVATANLNMAKIESKNSKINYKRYLELINKKSIAPKTFDDVASTYKLAKEKLISSKATLEQLIIQKNKKSIKAPYDGVIVSKNIHLHEWVNSGSIVAKIINTNKIDIIFNLPIDYVKSLNKNQTYKITLTNTIVNSKLYAIIPSGNALTRTFPVRFKATVKNRFTFDGEEAKVTLSKNIENKAFLINRDAVIKRFDQNIIFVIDDKSTAKMIPVKVVGFDGLKAGIKAKGLKKGMRVVVKGNERVFPNQIVKILD